MSFYYIRMSYTIQPHINRISYENSSISVLSKKQKNTNNYPRDHRGTKLAIFFVSPTLLQVFFNAIIEKIYGDIGSIR